MTMIALMIMILLLQMRTMFKAKVVSNLSTFDCMEFFSFLNSSAAWFIFVEMHPFYASVPPYNVPFLWCQLHLWTCYSFHILESASHCPKIWFLKATKMKRLWFWGKAFCRTKLMKDSLVKFENNSFLTFGNICFLIH